MPWSSFFECWVLSQLFHFPLSPLSISSLVSLVPSIRVVSSPYLRLLIFLPAILITSCASSSLAFHIMYSAFKLNKQDDNTAFLYSFPNLEPVNCFMCGSYWPAYRFLKRQVRWSGISISWRTFQFVVIHTIKGFSIVNEAEVDVFLELSCFFQWYNSCWHFDLWIPLPFLNPVCTSGGFWFTYCWSLAWRILCTVLLVYEMSSTIW